MFNSNTLSKHAEVCDSKELQHEIKFPSLWRQPSFCPFPSLQPQTQLYPTSSSSSSSFLTFLTILSSAALLPSEELSHGFPEPAIMLKR